MILRTAASQDGVARSEDVLVLMIMVVLRTATSQDAPAIPGRPILRMGCRLGDNRVPGPRRPS